MLRDLDVTDGEAENWGKLLRQRVKQESSSVTADTKPAIEEY